MEFQKHRQKVISETIKTISRPAQHNVSPVVGELPAGKQFLKHQEGGLKVYTKLIKAIEKLLKNPQTDSLYRCLKRIFSSDATYNLKRPNPKRYTVRRLAQKRFNLGYPPRKEAWHLGDATNWEWIVECAKKSTCNVVIVSRDGDFGLTYRQECILNDWLRVEFKERVSQRRKIELTNKLSTALKRLHNPLTRGDVEEENKLLIRASDIPTEIVSLTEFVSMLKDRPRISLPKGSDPLRSWLADPILPLRENKNSSDDK